ncbi:hypothetical protein R3I94_009381 [Phoxinus phoxinus]
MCYVLTPDVYERTRRDLFSLLAPSERESRAVHCAVASPPQTDLYSSAPRNQNGETTWQISTIKTKLKWTQQIWRMLKRWRKRRLGKTTVKHVS